METIRIAETPAAERTWRAKDVVIILLAATVLLAPSLFTRDLWNPDEPRYMEVAREMALMNDYLVPHLNGELYPDKPPMFFWLAAGLYQCGFGYNAGRIIVILAAVGTLLLTYSIARRIMPHPGPLLASLITLTGGLFLFTSRMGVIDPLLCFFVTLSIAAGLRALDPTISRYRFYWTAAYVAAGLAILTKGPVGLAIPVLVLLCYAVADRRNVRKGGWTHLAGALSLLIVVAAWLVPALITGGEAYRNNILFQQTAGRVVNSYSHRNPFYYYLLLSPALLAPWSLLFGLALVSAIRAWRQNRDRAAITGLTWFLPIIVFFSFISGKRTGYLLPLMPAFGLLTARYLIAGIEKPYPWPRLHKIFASITLWTVATVLVITLLGRAMAGSLALSLGVDIPEQAAEVANMPGSLALLLGIGAIAVLGVAFAAQRKMIKRNWQVLVIPLVIGIIVCASVLGDVALLPYANRFKSGKGFVAAAKESLETSECVFLYPKDFSGMYNLYTRRLHMPVLPTPEDLKNALSHENRVAVIGRDRDFKKVFPELPPELHVAANAQVGHRNMWLLTNWAASEAWKGARSASYVSKHTNEPIANP